MVSPAVGCWVREALAMTWLYKSSRGRPFGRVWVVVWHQGRAVDLGDGWHGPAMAISLVRAGTKGIAARFSVA